jgi:hypothetical protein
MGVHNVALAMQSSSYGTMVGDRVGDHHRDPAGDRTGVPSMTNNHRRPGLPGEPGEPGHGGEPGRKTGEGGRGGEGGLGGRGGAGAPQGPGGGGGLGGEGGRGARGATGPPGARGPQGPQPRLRWAPAIGYTLLALVLGFLILDNRHLSNQNRHNIEAIAAVSYAQAQADYRDCVERNQRAEESTAYLARLVKAHGEDHSYAAQRVWSGYLANLKKHQLPPCVKPQAHVPARR